MIESIGAKCSAEGRAEGVSWLASGAVESGQAATGQLPDLMQALALGASDKTAEVRGAATKLAEALAARFQPGELTAALSGLDGAQRKSANEAISRALGGGALPSATAPAATSARPASAAAVASSGTASLRSSVNGRPGSAAAASAGASANLRSSISRAPSGGLRSSLTLNK